MLNNPRNTRANVQHRFDLNPRQADPIALKPLAILSQRPSITHLPTQSIAQAFQYSEILLLLNTTTTNDDHFSFLKLATTSLQRLHLNRLRSRRIKLRNTH